MVNTNLVPGGIIIGIQSRRPQLIRITKPEEVTSLDGGVANLIELIAMLTELVHSYENTIKRHQSNFSKLSSQFEELYEKLRTAHSHSSIAQTAAALLARELRKDERERIGFDDQDEEDEE